MFVGTHFFLLLLYFYILFTFKLWEDVTDYCSNVDTDAVNGQGRKDTLVVMPFLII